MKTKVDLLEIEKRMMNSINSNIKTMIKGIDKLNSESPLDVLQDINSEELEGVLKLTADRLEDNYPYYHPLYLGQMIKPPHPVARAAYHLAQWVNPNNHAYEGGRASSVMEKEAIDEMAKVFGWENCLGHVCSGGTIGNLEALWISSELKPGRAIVASDQAHYTHEKNAKLLKVPFIKVRSDEFGKIDLNDLDYILKNNDVGTIIATLGTTSLGAIDPLDDILQRQNQYEFRIHIDAAYGGYFTLSSVMKSESYKHFKRLKDVDSIVIDPHKHGLQPYGCGCILFKDPSVGKIYKHDSPYTYFTSSDYHLGETTFECSRPGASAVALWATQKYFPLIKESKFSQGLDNCLTAAKKLKSWVEKREDLHLLVDPELDIVVFTIKADSISESTKKVQMFFDLTASKGVHVALVKMDSSKYNINSGEKGDVTCVRVCLIKWDHIDWIDSILKVFESTLEEVKS